ncbi:MAG: MFS transporter, partial [Bifidobacteriaceae bacterium]|nr:MFS transporter [Bifidobacteriaceae bacterium]
MKGKITKGYKEILLYKSAWKFSLAGALARLSFSSTLLALLYTIRHIYGSWTLASAISGSMLIISSILLPATAFLIDKFGQKIIGFCLTYLKVGSIIAVIILCHIKAPFVWTAISAFFICIFSVPYGSMVRRRWSYIIDKNDKGKIRSAFALENTVDNLIYVIGPLLITFVINNISPELALLIPALANFFGGTLLFIQTKTEPPKNKQKKVFLKNNLPNKNNIFKILDFCKKAKTSFLNNSNQISLVLIMILLFSFYGANDILARHIALSENSLWLNGLIISSVSAFGILSSALFPYIKKSWSFYLSLLAIAVLALPISSQNIYFFWANVCLCGFALSPIYILADIIINEL